MALSNHERVGKALDLLSDGLKPFVERELPLRLGPMWETRINILVDGRRRTNWADPHILLGVMAEHWQSVFRETLGKTERGIVGELQDVRNLWAHKEPFSTNDTIRALDNVARLLTAISAPEANAVEDMRMDLVRLQIDEQRRGEMRAKSFQPTEGKPQGGLKPWREVVTPHADVASGRYQQAEFAADLWQVYQGEGSDEYKKPAEFFRRTYLTRGLEDLLVEAINRLSGKGGDPVVELQTNFGGGKTHSMLALFHLFSGVPAATLPGIEPVLQEKSLTMPPKVRRAVIVGTKISPGQPQKKPDGTVVHTLWGEIAWQLGGKEGYAMVAEDDRRATNPGDRLKEVFNKYSPCLILVDEWVAYARQLHEGSDLPAGTFDTQFTFAQTLSESAKAAERTLLVVSIPASDNEIGGTWGQNALNRLKNAVGRVQTNWRPASADEGFEIVRRRLFEPLTNEQAVARDAVARAFSDMYAQQHQEFPQECKEGSYEDRIKMAYPVHPELFDRLYNDWSTLDRFQRTRGVLRLMAAVIHALWERQEKNLLIMPGNVPIDESSVQFELTRYMPDPWVPVIEQDIDGPASLPLAIDREIPNLGRYSACRRVARTIYLGSAPKQKAANVGLDERHVKLGCVQPGETVATFGDAIRRLSDKASYLYVDGKRSWYSTQPSVARMAEDRAARISDDDVAEEVARRLRKQANSRGDFAKVHVCVKSSDVPDDYEARLVILGPEFPHTAKNATSSARTEADAILQSRGTSPRTYRNTLVFAVGDATRLQDLRSTVQQALAWESIRRDASGNTPSLNLDNYQLRQTETKSKYFDEAVDAQIPEAYPWLLVPGHSDPRGAVEWSELKLSGSDALAVRASKKLRNDELLMTTFGGVRLRMELDRVPLWRSDTVSVKQLAADFASYLYLPRLRDSDVLAAAIQDGVANLSWASETFGYAENVGDKGRFEGLAGGKGSVRVLMDGRSVLVKGEVAEQQVKADQAKLAAAGGGSGTTAGGGGGAETGGGTAIKEGKGKTPPPAVLVKRFHGSVQLDSLQVGKSASKIADEVIKHLSGLDGAEVTLTLEIHAEVPDGIDEKTQRDVNENCRSLGFESHGFESA
jgi:predicted AAA+ superfamily ATPase